MKKSELSTLADIEEYFSKARKIYLESPPTQENYKEFIDWFISESPATYYRNGNVHCPRHRDRSISDIIVLCKVYYNTPIADVLKHLDTVQHNRTFCYVVRKYVFSRYKYPYTLNENRKNNQTEIGGMMYSELINLCK